MSSELNNHLDTFAMMLFGRTRSHAKLRGTCVKCNKVAVFLSSEDCREFQTSGLCSSCYNGIMETTNE